MAIESEIKETEPYGVLIPQIYWQAIYKPRMYKKPVTRSLEQSYKFVTKITLPKSTFTQSPPSQKEFSSLPLLIN